MTLHNNILTQSDFLNTEFDAFQNFYEVFVGVTVNINENQTHLSTNNIPELVINCKTHKLDVTITIKTMFTF